MGAVAGTAVFWGANKRDGPTRVCVRSVMYSHGVFRTFLTYWWIWIPILAGLAYFYILVWALEATSTAGRKGGTKDATPWIPYVPAPWRAVDAMLELCEPKRGETMYDLGCGDARIICRAATKFGVNGVGLELAPAVYFMAQLRNIVSCTTSLVKIRRESFYTVDLRAANIVVLFLLPSALLQLRHKLVKELPPGSRVVSFRWPLQDWGISRKSYVPCSFTSSRRGPSLTPIYLYEHPFGGPGFSSHIE